MVTQKPKINKPPGVWADGNCDQAQLLEVCFLYLKYNSMLFATFGFVFLVLLVQFYSFTTC